MVSFCKLDCKVAVLYPTAGLAVKKTRNARHIFHYSGFKPVHSLRLAIESFDPDFIVPTCDRGVQHLHELHAMSRSEGDAGRKTTALIERSLGSSHGFPIVSSRFELLKIAQSEGILVPATAAIENDADLQLWNAKSSPPWMIKADGTWGGKGVKIAKDTREARNVSVEFAQRDGLVALVTRLLLNRDRDWALYDWKQSRRSVIAQSTIDGRPANCAVVCWQGKVLAGIAVEVIKARGATGPATVVQLVPGREMIAAAETLARRLGISGFFGLDFMIERETGAVYLIEMNPRCTPPCPLPLGNGRNLVAAISAQLSGQPPAKSQPAIEQSLIEYFPPVSQSAGSVYHANVDDIPEEALELLHDLVQPWSGRSAFGRLIDLVRWEQHQEATFIASSTEDRQTSVRKSFAVETP
jgi:ATP-grasp domain